MLSKSSLDWWWFDCGHLHSLPWEMRCPLSAPQCLRAGTKWHHCCKPSRRPGPGWLSLGPISVLCEEVLVHHCKKAGCLVCVAPKWTSALEWTACPVQTPAHVLVRRFSAFCLSLVWLHFRECLIPQVPLKRYHIDYNFGMDYYYCCYFATTVLLDKGL